MALTITPQERAASHAMNLKIQFNAACTQWASVQTGLKNLPTGVTAELLQAALGENLAPMNTLIAALPPA
jgi:hypothetical protein